MQVTVKGKHMDVGEALSSYVQDNLGQTTAKFFPNAIDSQVTVSKHGHAFTVDIQIHAGRGLVVQGHGNANDAHQAFDAGLAKVERQLKRYKSRLVEHHGKGEATTDEFAAPSYVIESATSDDHAEAPEAPTIVAEMQTPIATLSVSEAVMRLDLADLPALLFKNSAHGGLNMVYRRKDGHIGWIDPAGNAKTAAA